MAGQYLGEAPEVVTFQGLDQLQHFAFGVGALEGQAEVVQQPAEQGAVEQAEGFAGVVAPEAFGFGGDIVGQAFGCHFQAEQLGGGVAADAGGQADPVDEGGEPFAVAPDQQQHQADDQGPEQDLDDLGEEAEGFPEVPQGHEATDEAFEGVLVLLAQLFLLLLRLLVLVQAPAGHRLAVGEGRGVENGLDVVPGGCAGEGLVEQAVGIGAHRVDLLFRLGGLVAGSGRVGHRLGRGLLCDGGCGRQGEGQADAQAQQQGVGDTGQALAQAAEHQLDVPGFQLGAAVQVEGEAAGDVDRLPDDQHEGVEQVGQVLDPDPLTFLSLQQLLPVHVDDQLLGQHQVEEGDEAGEQRPLQVHADDGQPGGPAGVALAQHGQALAARNAGQTFELHDRHVETAGGAEAAPGQGGDDLSPGQARPGLERFAQGRGVAEQGAGEDVQRQAFEQRLEPPEGDEGPGGVLPQQQADDDEHRQGGQRPAGHQQAGVAAGQQDAQVHGLPGAARADGDGGVSQAHGHPVRQR